MSREIVVAGCLIWVSAACSPDKGFGNTEEVSADAYGAAWPLTSDTAKVTCSENGVLSVTVDGTTYALRADQSEEPKPRYRLDVVRAADPATADGYKDLTPLIEFGETLCD